MITYQCGQDGRRPGLKDKCLLARNPLLLIKEGEELDICTSTVFHYGFWGLNSDLGRHTACSWVWEECIALVGVDTAAGNMDVECSRAVPIECAVYQVSL